MITRRDFVVSALGAAVASMAPLAQAAGANKSAVLSSEPTQINVLDFGAVADAVYDSKLAGWAGTDNRQAFQEALNFASTIGAPVFVPPGHYRFSRIPGKKVQYLTAPAYMRLIGAGNERSILCIDHDPNEKLDGNKGAVFLGSSTSIANSRELDIHDLFELRDIGFRGLWSWHPDGYRVHAIRARNTKRVILERVSARDICGFFSLSAYNGSFHATNNLLERIAVDGIRCQATSFVYINGNTIRWCDDDAIAVPEMDEDPLGARPIRCQITVTNNQLENCEGIVILAPANVVVANNTLRRCYGTGIAVVSTGAVADAGGGPGRSVIIANNVVEDQLRAMKRSVDRSVSWMPPGNAISIGGASSRLAPRHVPSGSYNSETGQFIRPYDTHGTPAWGALHVVDIVEDKGDFDVASGYMSTGFIVSNNIIKRTLPSVQVYSDWGYGQMFSRYGFQDPRMSDTEFALDGIVIAKDVDGCKVNGNYIEGFSSGVGILFASRSLNGGHFVSCHVHGNTIKDVKHGISERPVKNSKAKYQGLMISENLIDCDPWHKSALRHMPLDGSWKKSESIEAPTGILFNEIGDIVCRINTFRNCYIPYRLGIMEASYSSNLIQNNIAYAEPSSTGFSQRNKGVGYIYYSSPSISYVVIDADPRKAQFGLVKNVMAASRSNCPSMGTYVEGHLVYNDFTLTRHAFGWKRLTTGSGHTLGKDWLAIQTADACANCQGSRE